MQLAALIALLALAAPADPPAGAGAPAEKAKVTIQVLAAKAGENATGQGVDPRLAAKLRVSLAQMGMQKPDITSLVRPTTSAVGPGEAKVVTSGNGGAEATCKAVDDEGITLSVALFTEVKEGKKPVRKRSDPTTVKFSKPGQVQPFVQPDEEGGLRIYVVGAVKEGDAAKGAGEPPKDKK